MDDVVWIELIKNIPAIIGATASVITAFGLIILGYWTYKSKISSEANLVKIEAATEKLEEVRKDVNGQSKELNRVTHALGFSEGKAVGKLEDNTPVK